MNYMKITNSMSALKEITQLRLPYAKARDIYKLYKLFEEEYNFFAQEEKKLVIEYAGKNTDGSPNVSANGVIIFSDQQSKTQYALKLAELCAQECDIKIKPVKLCADEFGTQMITPETMTKLEGIIYFE